MDGVAARGIVNGRGGVAARGIVNGRGPRMRGRDEAE